MKVLWLASWYPSQNDPLTGDFFQRHAQAASMHFDISVLHIKRDDSVKNPKTINRYNNLIETIVLYKPALSFIKGLSSIISAFTWWQLSRKEIDSWIKENGKPNIIHVHAAWKFGVIAYYYKRKLGIPYFISEQYTGYFEEAKGVVPTFNKFQNYFIKKVYQNANKVLPVSAYLGNALNKKYAINFTVLDNVVNTSIFKPSINLKNKNSKLKLLHVSLLNLQKNPLYLFDACKVLVEKNIDFQLSLVAPYDIANQYLSLYPSLKNHVKILTETNQINLAAIMQDADALLFPSLFESFGLVAYEAIACGTPVIVSDIDVFKKHLGGKEFVSFCDLKSPYNLAEKIIKLNEEHHNISPLKMNDFIKTSFSQEAIGEQFKEIYVGY